MTALPMLAAAVLALAASAPAWAQNTKVFRCEDAAGRVTYADEPCRGGVELKNADERSPEQRKEAAEVVRREERLGDKLARERRAAEKVRPPGAAHIAHSAAEKAAKEKPAAARPAKKKSEKARKPAAADKPQA